MKEWKLDNLNFKDLLEESKEKLERIKLAQEISTFQKREYDDRRKYRSSNLLLFIMAIVTTLSGLATTYITKTWDFKNSEHERLVKRVDDLITSYIDGKNPETRKGFACELAAMNKSEVDPIVKVKTKLYVTICLTIDSTTKVIQIQTASIDKIDTSSTATKKWIKTVSQLELQINDLEVMKNKPTSTFQQQQLYESQIFKANAQIRSLSDSSATLRAAVKSSNEISQNLMEQIKILNIPSGPSRVKTFGVRWFKEGYFQQFDSLRITLLDIDKKSRIQVQVCEAVGAEPCRKLLAEKEWISFSKPLEIPINNLKYKINLQAIDRAGKNPFTMAAYITVDVEKAD